MSGGRALAPVLLVLVAACGASRPFVPYATTLEATPQQCRSSTASEHQCNLAGQWLDFQGRADEALALHRRACQLGSTLSCYEVVRQADDPEARRLLCTHPTYGSWPECRIWLATTAPTAPGRGALIEKQCASPTDCAVALANLLATDEPGRRWAAETCAVPAPDQAFCTSIAQRAWPDPALAVALRRTLEHRGCAPGVGAICLAAAEPGLLAEALADVAAARALVRRGCQLGADVACAREQALVQRDEWLARCKRGDLEACRLLGFDSVTRRGAAGLDPP